MELVRARQSDLPTLLRWVEAFYREDRHHFDGSRIESALREVLDQSGLAEVYLVQEGDLRIGYLIVAWAWGLEYFGRDAMLDEMYITRSSATGDMGERRCGHSR